ncbi:FeoB-associated Cys-rich membrane protein [Pseudopedobacter sp.]|uniref:FeoB-associated Cys-rich membrane protein n=1 Tax=Pseudopedobacter sp. TaxID=1936787 RepID=UPI00334136F2
MDTQTILVFAIFALAVFYISRLVYRSVFAKKGCASNCGKCAADFSNIQNEKK